MIPPLHQEIVHHQSEPRRQLQTFLPSVCFPHQLLQPFPAHILDLRYFVRVWLNLNIPHNEQQVVHCTKRKANQTDNQCSKINKKLQGDGNYVRALPICHQKEPCKAYDPREWTLPLVRLQLQYRARREAFSVQHSSLLDKHDAQKKWGQYSSWATIFCRDSRYQPSAFSSISSESR